MRSSPQGLNGSQNYLRPVIISPDENAAITMKPDTDPKLSKVLATWEVSPPPAPHFNFAVWQRIAAQEERSARGAWATVREWLFVQLPKPAYALALLVVTATLSITAANFRADQARAQYRLDSARQYLASIDPMAMTAGAVRASR